MQKHRIGILYIVTVVGAVRREKSEAFSCMEVDNMRNICGHVIDIFVYLYICTDNLSGIDCIYIYIYIHIYIYIDRHHKATSTKATCLAKAKH